MSLTSYHAHTAQLLDRHVDVILVGDSLGMVMHGLETTVPVTVEMMIVHGRAVVRGTKRALITVDLPFGSYERAPTEAFHTAVRVLKETGAAPEAGRRRAHGRDRALPGGSRNPGHWVMWASRPRRSTRSAPSRRADATRPKRA